MEHNDHVLDLEASGKMEMTPQGAGYLNNAGKWGQFLAIVGFIMVGLFVVGGIAVMIYLQTEIRYSRGFQPILGLLIYIGLGVLYFFPTLYLFRFSRKAIRYTKIGGTVDDLTDSLKNLNRMFRFVGVLTIVILSIYIILLMVGLFGASRFF